MYINENLRRYMLMKDAEIKVEIAKSETGSPSFKNMVLLSFLFGLSSNFYTSSVYEEYKKKPEEFKAKLNKIKLELEEGLNAKNTSEAEKQKIRKALHNIDSLNRKINIKTESFEYLDEGIRTFIKKRDYSYLKKIDDGSKVTSEELILGFCIGVIPTAVIGTIIRKRVQKDPEAFKAKLEQIHNELEEAKKDEEISDEESKKTNVMIAKIAALNILVSNLISAFRKNKINKDKI